MAGQTILVVEDDDVTRASFGAILSEHGYNVALAESGSEGLAFLRAHKAPDLIVLDMLMGDMDGWGFLKERDARWSSVPVLITTALAIASKEWAAALGAYCWLKKPIDPAVLLERVRTCLG